MSVQTIYLVGRIIGHNGLERMVPTEDHDEWVEPEVPRLAREYARVGWKMDIDGLERIEIAK